MCQDRAECCTSHLILANNSGRQAGTTVRPILQIPKTEVKSHNLQAAYIAWKLRQSVDASVRTENVPFAFCIVYVY